MSSVSTPWFDSAVSALNDPQNQRVWSVIVSAFGDLAQTRGDRLSGSVLRRIIMPLGIKSDAIRVALHRLRKDGWIESARSGRQSAHFLTEFGRAQSASVTPRIYQGNAPAPVPRHILIANDPGGQHRLDDLLEQPDYFSIGRSIALGQGPSPTNLNDLLAFDVTVQAVPDWFRDRLCPPDLVDACRALHSDLQSVLQNGPAPSLLSPLQIATLRTLIVHRWRRVVLRHADLPDIYFPVTWAGPACRQMVMALLEQLPRPDPLRLEAALSS